MFVLTAPGVRGEGPAASARGGALHVPAAGVAVLRVVAGAARHGQLRRRRDRCRRLRRVAVRSVYGSGGVSAYVFDVLAIVSRSCYTVLVIQTCLPIYRTLQLAVTWPSLSEEMIVDGDVYTYDTFCTCTLLR